MVKQAEPVMARDIRLLGKCDSSHWFHPSVVWLYLLSEFIGKLDDGFSQPIIVKYKTNIPFQSLKGRLDSSNKGEQSQKLAQRWWVDLLNAHATLDVHVM